MMSAYVTWRSRCKRFISESPIFNIDIWSSDHLTSPIISSSTGYIYEADGSLLFDPGRLRVLVFDETNTKSSDGIWLIPFSSLGSVNFKVTRLQLASTKSCPSVARHLAVSQRLLSASTFSFRLTAEISTI